MAKSTKKARNTKKTGTKKRAASRKQAGSLKHTAATKRARTTKKAATKRATKSVGQYADVNGLRMYYEVHGKGQPLVLLHGAFSAIGSSFGKMLPGLAQGRQVIGIEMQAHGHTADIDRPLSIAQLADDTAAFITQRGQGRADVLGYSMGGAVALQVAIRHPQVVRKLVVMSVASKGSGIHPGLMDGLGQMQPEMMHGSPWHDEYIRIAPRPEDFNRLFAKKTEMDRGLQDVPDEAIRSLPMPVLLVIGDSDLARPEHAVELFRLLGGGVFGDVAGLPKSRLAVLPGTTHVGASQDRFDWVVSMVNDFLDAPLPEPVNAIMVG
jgi:pimeloyl-ACP methyl ester carboxylesterase